MGLRPGTWVRLRGLAAKPEWNGSFGQLVSFVASKERWIVKRMSGTGAPGERVLIKSANLEATSLTRAQLQLALESCKPQGGLRALALADAGATFEARKSEHLSSDHLSEWASCAEAQVLLADADALAQLVQKTGALLLFVGAWSGDFVESCHDAVPTVVLPCLACNTCYEASGGCQHEYSRARTQLTGNDKTIEPDVHMLVTKLALLVGILNMEASAELTLARSALIDLLSPDLTPGLSEIEQVARTWAESGQTNIPSLLVGAIDNCCHVFPKVAHLSGSLLSFLVCARPSTTLCWCDPHFAAPALCRYVLICSMRAKGGCLVENAFAVTQMLNIVPFLYHLGDWRAAGTSLVATQLPASVASLAINLLHSIVVAGQSDEPLDLDQFPELFNARVSVDSLFGGADFARAHPKAFLLGCLIEVQGRWQHKGVDVSGAGVTCTPPPELACSLTLQQQNSYTEPVAQCWQEYLLHLRVFASAGGAAHELAFTLPVVDALIAGIKHPALPDRGFLRETLHAGMHCNYPGCFEIKRAGGAGEKLLACSGCRLAFYCCPEHQRAHWPRHKACCIRNVKKKKTKKSKKKSQEEAKS